MVEEDRNTFLKSIDKKIDGLKDMFTGLKAEDTDVIKFEKALGVVEDQVKEYKDQSDLVKSLEGEKTDLQKTIEDKDTEIKTLEKTIADGEVDKEKEVHDALVRTAIDLVKDLDAKTEIKDEDSYVEALNKSFTEEEIKEGLDSCIKTDIKAMEIAKTKIADGDIPGQGDNDPEDELDEDAQRTKELRKKYVEEGLLVDTGDE